MATITERQVRDAFTRRCVEPVWRKATGGVIGKIRKFGLTDRSIAIAVPSLRLPGGERCIE